MVLTHEQKFQAYLDQVESGNYKSHADMIKKYQKLLEKVPTDSELYRKIENEIDAHECDEMTDRKETRKKRSDEKINITIDPELLAEMQAEARKSPEQRIKERDEFLNTFYDMGISRLMEMKSEISKPVTADEPTATTAPVKKPGRFNDIF